MYRHRSGDIQYFPLISQLARGTITDGTIKETERSVFRSFPHATLLPHAICFSAFGKYGFPVADAIVAVAYFFLLVLFFQTLGVSRPLGTTVALFIALQVSLTLKVNAGLGKHTISLPLITWLWGMRIPRPFVSELYMLLMLVTEIWVLASRDAGRLIH